MIYVDEDLPEDDYEPQFEHRQVTIQRCRDVRAQYEMLNEIGRGKFGRVMKCRRYDDNDDDIYYAAKFVQCTKREDRRNVEREVEIMNGLSDPKLLYLFDAFDNGRNEFCLVTEYIGGGELFDRVIEDEFVLTEKACAAFMRQIVEGVAYIHSKNILHLDLKPENIMCTTKTGNRIKIIDFGLARTFEPQKKLQVLFGTPEFVAPEVVAFEPIGFATDMWAVGVICYVLLSGLSPFMGDNDLETMANVTIAEYDYDDEAFDNISSEAKNFIDKLLVKEKGKRFSAEQCLKHTWLNLNRKQKEKQLTAGKQNLTQHQDHKTEEQNYVFDSSTRTMMFAGSSKKMSELDEEMFDAESRKRAGEQDVQTESVIQRKRSKTPSDDSEANVDNNIDKTVDGKTIITLDEVNHKADEIREHRRHSLTEGSMSLHSTGDSKKLSVLDETIWQAAERTVTPLLEIAPSPDHILHNKASPEPPNLPTSCTQEHSKVLTPPSPKLSLKNFLTSPQLGRRPLPPAVDLQRQKEIPGTQIRTPEEPFKAIPPSPTRFTPKPPSISPEPTRVGVKLSPVSQRKVSSSPEPSPDTFRKFPASTRSNITAGSQMNLNTKDRLQSDSAKIELPSNCHAESRLVSPVIEEPPPQEFRIESPQMYQVSELNSEHEKSSKASSKEVNGDMSQTSRPETRNSYWGVDEETADSESIIEELKDLMDHKNWGSAVSSKTGTPTKSMYSSAPTKTNYSPMTDLLREVDKQIKLSSQEYHRECSRATSTPASKHCFGNVREDIALMKNELSSLKKDLTSAKKGLESDKKPLMDIMNRLDPTNTFSRDLVTTSSTGNQFSSSRHVADAQRALEDLKRTMNHPTSSKSSYTNGTGPDSKVPIRKILQSANTGSVSQFKTRFEQKPITNTISDVRQDAVARIMNPRNKSVTPFRNVKKSPSPAPPTSLRRRSPSPVCTGNVSRVRSRFESGSSTQSNLSTTVTSSHQTLPKTFKIRDFSNTKNEQRLTTLTSGVESSRLSYSPQTKFEPSSSKISQGKNRFDRQTSVPLVSQGKSSPARQLSQDMIEGAKSFLTQTLPIQAKTNSLSRTHIKGPFGFSNL